MESTDGSVSEAIHLRSPQSLVIEDTPQHLENAENAAQTIIEVIQDIFKAPDGAVLIHATNCLGVWGSGIAAVFRKKYPRAFTKHRQHCREAEGSSHLVGTCQLIPPQPGDPKGAHGPHLEHWIACLFTSERYGVRRDTQTEILRSTEQSLRQLRDEVEARREQFPSGHRGRPGDLYICQINSGRFGVPWEQTKRVVEECFEGFEGRVTVVVRGAEAEDGQRDLRRFSGHGYGKRGGKAGGVSNGRASGGGGRGKGRGAAGRENEQASLETFLR